MRKHRKTKLKVYLAASTMLLATHGLEHKAHAQSLGCAQPLIFGSIIPCMSAGDVTVTPSGARSTTGCVTLGGAPYSRARCVVTQNPPFKPIQISVTPTPATMSATAASMTVDNFNIITDAGGNATTAGTNSPVVDIPIGATLNVGANQTGGTYSGTFTVNANFP